MTSNIETNSSTLEKIYERFIKPKNTHDGDSISNDEEKRLAVWYAVSGDNTCIEDKYLTQKVLEYTSLSNGQPLSLSSKPSLTDECADEGFFDLPKTLKIKNRFSDGASVAIYNVSENNPYLRTTVSAFEAGMKKKASYMYYEYFTGEFGYVNGDEYIDVAFGMDDSVRYYTFIEKTNKQPLLLGRIDKLNLRAAVVSENSDTVTMIEGGEFAFVSDEDYAVFNELGDEIICERYGILTRGCSDIKDKVLKFIKYDFEY